jgi:hypothetical protein
MSGFFGVVSKTICVDDVFYGTDYHSHLGTKRAGMVFIVPQKGFRRSIHNLENAYFRNKFEDELKDFKGNSGLGIISDTDPQPILFNSHLGRFAEGKTVYPLLGRFELLLMADRRRAADSRKSLICDGFSVARSQ